MSKTLAAATLLTVAAAIAAASPTLATQTPPVSSAQVSVNVLRTAKHLDISPSVVGGLHRGARPGSLPGTDSIVTYSGGYTVPNFDFSGNPQSAWTYQFAGSDPSRGGTTNFQAPVMPVTVNLLAPDGSVAYTESPGTKVAAALASPVFSKALFSSAKNPTQYNDAIQRATFPSAPASWHTMLTPTVITPRSINVPFGSYHFGLKPDGSLAFALVDSNAFINLVFPTVASDTTTPIGAAENAKEMTTKDISTLLMGNVFLYLGDVNQCCVLGFHSYDFEPGTPSNGNRERNYIMNYSSWADPALFGEDIADVSTLTHEMAEIVNDPFVLTKTPAGAAVPYDETPWWSSGAECQFNLEVGDVIESLPGSVHPMTLNGALYHLSNVALLPWFTSATPSSGLNGAYSYPDPVLTKPNTPQNPGCAP